MLTQPRSSRGIRFGALCHRAMRAIDSGAHRVSSESTISCGSRVEISVDVGLAVYSFLRPNASLCATGFIKNARQPINDGQLEVSDGWGFRVELSSRLV